MATSSTTQREDTKQTARLQSGNASNHEKINLGDTASLKKALDDEVIKVRLYIYKTTSLHSMDPCLIDRSINLCRPSKMLAVNSTTHLLISRLSLD